MSYTTTHDAALFEEGFMLVAVDYEDVQEIGEKTLWEAIQEHDWVVEQETPVVIVYQSEDGDIRAYGDKDLVDAVTEMDYDAIEWGHELTLEWEDDEE